MYCYRKIYASARQSKKCEICDKLGTEKRSATESHRDEAPTVWPHMQDEDNLQEIKNSDVVQNRNAHYKIILVISHIITIHAIQLYRFIHSYNIP